MQSYSKALAIQEPLVRGSPGVTKFQSVLAAINFNIGNLERNTDHPDRALRSYSKALAIQEPLVRDNPSVTQFQGSLAEIHNRIGLLQSEAGHPVEALESHSKALAIWERLAREPQRCPVPARPGRKSQRHRGTPARDGPSGPGTGVARQGAGDPRAAAREHPESPDYASDFGGTVKNMATIDLDAKRFEQARDKLHRAISWQKKALAANPGHPTYRQFLRNHLTNLINAAKALGNEDEARAAQHELDELAANDPAKAALDQRLTAVIRGEAPKDERERLQLAYRAYEKGLSAASTRLYSDALEADPKLADDRQAQHRYNAACAAALAAGAQTTPTLPSPIGGEESLKTSAPLVGEDRGGGRLSAGGGPSPPLSDAERASSATKPAPGSKPSLAPGPESSHRPTPHNARPSPEHSNTGSKTPTWRAFGTRPLSPSCPRPNASNGRRSGASWMRY